MADAADNGELIEKYRRAALFFLQHRDVLCWWGFRRDLNLKTDFTLRNIAAVIPPRRPTLARTAGAVVEAKYIPDAGAVEIFISLREKARARGSGFGYGMVYPDNPESVARTLSARYQRWRRNSVDRGWDMAKAK